jgi:alanyl-tRNA synthetase
LFLKVSLTNIFLYSKLNLVAMKSDKEVKKEFKAKASKTPENYYAVNVLKNEGFERKKCSCGIFFWTVTDQNTCDDPSCSGGFRFIGNTPAKEQLDYIQLWKKFSKLFTKWGYTPIDRYPVAARWRDDTDFVQASIYDFQPYVVSGEVQPPANPLVVPQLCLRFNDIDNVGITGAHYTGFVMIGQHAFMKPEDWSQDKYFTDIYNWCKEGLGLPNKEITFHEDAWAGGGNFGPCMEFFSRGLELGNQVYMMYEQTPAGNKELNLKVLDMGMGHERNAWFTHGTSTSYETTFPTVSKKLHELTGIKVDQDLMQRFLPYSSYLNVDEVENIDETWKFVANRVDEDVNVLKSKILPLAALYSVAEHSRSLLVALNDGALPSNVGGGYNLRVILRRALSFIDKFGWRVELGELAEMHAAYLKPLFPELGENLDEVNEIFDVEKNKYKASRQKSRQIVDKLFENEKVNIDDKKLMELYDSNGISPELIREEAAKLGKKVKVPADFYARVAELHEQSTKKFSSKKEEKLSLDDVHETQALYFNDYLKSKSKGKVLKIVGDNVVLDRTVAYPTSGGQIHDTGMINGEEFVDVFKQGNNIVHVMKDSPGFKAGSSVEVEVNVDRRKQLAQNHTATHIVNAAAKKVLGNHINQAGAKKDVKKATIDLTHYQNLTEEEVKEIEEEANSIIAKNIKIELGFFSRTDAEQKFGMRIYQGGVVPGNNLRIVNIKGVDVEACGGTHLASTSEAVKIKILKSSKISDSIVRLVFAAGNAAEDVENKDANIVQTAAKILVCTEEQVPARALELFGLWKKVVKKKKKVDSKKLISTEEFKGDVLIKTAEVLKTQPEHIIKTLERFKKEIG